MTIASHASDGGEQQDEPTYTVIEVKCPACGGAAFTDGVDEPSGMDGHVHSFTCGDCGTRAHVQYRAIDIVWSTDETPEGMQHSAVCSGRTSLSTYGYGPDYYAPVDDDDAEEAGH